MRRSSCRSANDSSLRSGACAAEERAQARDELLVRERLDQVVVGACLEPDHPVAHRVSGREHQNGQLVTLGAKLLADLHAVATGHHHVEHDSVKDPCAQMRECLVAVLGDLDLEAMRDEHAPESLPQRCVIVDNQNRHAASVRQFSEASLKSHATPKTL